MHKPTMIAGGAGAALIAVAAVAIVATGDRPPADQPDPAPRAAAPERPAADNRPQQQAPAPRQARASESPDAEDWQARAEEWLQRLPPERREQIRERMEAARSRWIARYDEDGDGQLDEDERAEMERQREEFRQRHLARARERIDDLFGGSLGLDDGEVMHLSRMVARDLRGQIDIDRDTLRARADADGDGELSSEESRRARELARESIRRQMEEATREYADRFDLDRSGDLDAFERREAGDLLRAQIQHQRAMVRLDSTRTGSLDSMDVVDYMARFGDQDRRADLNGDGLIGNDDFDLFQNLLADPTPPIEGFGEADFGRRGWGGWGGRRRGGDATISSAGPGRDGRSGGDRGEDRPRDDG